MKPGILEVARACGAQIVPFQVRSTPAIAFGKKLKHLLPVPFSRVDVRRGEPLDGTTTLEDCQKALDVLF